MGGSLFGFWTNSPLMSNSYIATFKINSSNFKNKGIVESFHQSTNATEGSQECGAALKKTGRPGFRRRKVLVHRHSCFTHAQARNVCRSEQNCHLACVATSTKTRFCRAIWLRLSCAHGSSHVTMSCFVYIFLHETQQKVPRKRASCNILTHVMV